MDTYVKRIKFEAVKDSKSFSDLSKSMSDLSFKWSDELKQELKEVEQLQFEIKELSDQFKVIEDLKGDKFDELRKELQKEIDSRKKELNSKVKSDDEKSKEEEQLKAQEDLFTSIFARIEDLSKSFLSQLGNLFSSAWSELKEITDFSRLSSAQTRNLAFTYGFDSSQAYGYTQAMSMMGFESEEDLMYATNEEISRFRELFQKYTSWYETVGEEELKLYRDFEIEMAEFKQDLKLTVVDFFMDNKDDIKRLIEVSFDIGEALITTLGWLLKYFGGEEVRSSSERTAAASDIISNYVSNSNTSNKNANFNNTFNIKADSQEAGKTVGGNILLQIQSAFGGM